MIFYKSLKRWSVSCYTDRLLANQIARKPVRISWHLIMAQYHLRQGGYKIKCNSDSWSLTDWSHKTLSALLFWGPAHTDSLWPSLTRAKWGQAQFDAGKNERASESSWAGTSTSFASCNITSKCLILFTPQSGKATAHFVFRILWGHLDFESHVSISCCIS